LADTFKVVGPNGPVIAQFGSEVVLPCLLVPGQTPEGMLVRWYLSKWEKLVHLYRESDPQDQNKDQLKEYQGRTQMFESQMPTGNVSLRLLDLRLSDAGSYVCFVGSKNLDEQVQMELKVAGLGQHPVIHVAGFRNKQIRLACESSHWYPEPRLTWSVGNSRNVTGTLEISTESHTGLMTVRSLIEVSRGQENRYTCQIHNSLLGIQKQTSLQINGVFFPRVTTRLVTFCVFLLMLVALACPLPCLLQDPPLRTELKCRPPREDYWDLQSQRAQVDKELAYERGLSESEPLRYLRHAETLILDQVSLNPWLIVNEAMTTVRGSDIQKSMPDNPERFDTEPFALATVGFTSGLHYWEIEVEDKTSWDLGVARESVTRKGDITLNPTNGYWSIGRFWGGFEANAGISVRIEVKTRPRKIGVFLQYQEGKVSFYDADLMVHLYTFQDKFTEKVYPFICPWWSREDIILIPVER
uniref:Zinc-binding protein A33-like n=1 Tax=Callorhinchus milii TaxID=7868 RepID=A0A4W3HJF0_CALMI